MNNCKKCGEDVGWKGNLYEGLCHDCWRKAHPKQTCEFCIHASFGLGEDGETLIKCKAGVKTPLDCYALQNVPNACDKQVLKEAKQ